MKGILITGPTGSGKTELSLRLARILDGEVVNADSVQFYRGFNIGAAKPPTDARKNVRHHFLDICDEANGIDAAKFLSMVKNVIVDIDERGHVPIVVGSSGLYLRTLLGGISQLPSSNHSLRQELEGESSECLFDRLVRIAPERVQQIHRNDRIRLIRAIEILLSAEQPQHEVSGIPMLVIVIVWPREQLYVRINERAFEMVDRGIVDETGKLLGSYGEGHHLLKSLGYAESVRVLKGEIDIETLPSIIAMNHRRYAKRQITFWRNEPQKRRWQIEPKLLPNRGLPSLDLTMGVLVERFLKVQNCPFPDTQVWYVSGPVLFSNPE